MENQTQYYFKNKDNKLSLLNCDGEEISGTFWEVTADDYVFVVKDSKGNISLITSVPKEQVCEDSYLKIKAELPECFI